MWSQFTAEFRSLLQKEVKHTCGLKDLCSTCGLYTVRAEQAAHLELGRRSPTGFGVAPLGDVNAALTAWFKRAIGWEEPAGARHSVMWWRCCGSTSRTRTGLLGEEHRAHGWFCVQTEGFHA